MSVEELIVYGKSKVTSTHAKMLLADILNVNPLELLTILDKQVEEEKIELYKKELEALQNNKPIQYVIGHVNFYGNPFFVTEDVLIPRFETEELVENVLEYSKQFMKENLSILDLGCGSGIIGLTLKQKLPNSTVTMVDISEKALEITRKNALNLGLDVKVIKSDWFKDIPLQTYDIIVSNPPYIRTNEEIDPLVLQNEPALALYGGVDGLDCYRSILKDIKKYSSNNTLIAFEIGYLQKELLTEIVEKVFPSREIIVKKDLQGRNRMLFVLPKFV